MAQSLLVISRHAPWSGIIAREALDLVLAGGAMDLPIALLLRGDAVFQLVKAQNAQILAQKNLYAHLEALPLYSITALYACLQSLRVRGICPNTLDLPVQALEHRQIQELLNAYDQVITF